MSYWSHNPELLDEITIKTLPTEWREKVESEEIDLYDVPEDIRDKAMMLAVENYWGDKYDQAKLQHEEIRAYDSY